MGNVTKIRSDYDADKLRKLAKQSDDADQTRRLLALAAIYDGRAPRSGKIGGVGLQTVRDRVVAFNKEGPRGLIDGKAPGKPPLLNKRIRAALRKAIENGSLPAIHGVVRWRLLDLMQ